MTYASYNEIAEWYDQFLRERPVYTEVILPNLLTLLGEVNGEVICDLACGQGWTRSGRPYLIRHIPSAGSSPAISTNDNGSPPTPMESAAGSETITAC